MRDSRWAVNELTPKLRKFLQLLKQRSKKEKASVSQSAISFHSSRLDMSRYLNLKKSLKSLMRLDCTCVFSVYFPKSEIWIVPIIKPINWNMGPHHIQLDFYRQTLDRTWSLVSRLIQHIIQLSFNLSNKKFKPLPRLDFRTVLEHNIIINARAHNKWLIERQI